MIFTKYRNTIRWVIIVISFIIISLILWNTYVFFQNFKAEERTKMQNWSFAQKELSKTTDLNKNISDLPFEIIKSNNTTPMIVVDKDGSVYSYNNIDEEKAKDSSYINKLILKFENENTPIKITYQDEVLSTIYYGNSPLLNKLKYYPLALLLIIVLFGGVVFFFYRSKTIFSCFCFTISRYFCFSFCNNTSHFFFKRIFYKFNI